MNVSRIISVVSEVLKNKDVVIAAVIVFLYLDFIFYIANYRKKRKPPQRKIISSAPAASETEGSGDSDSGDNDAGGSSEILD